MVRVVCGERGFGGALRKSHSLSHRSSVLNRWQTVSSSPLGNALTGECRISSVVETGYKFWVFHALDKEFINKVFSH